MTTFRVRSRRPIAAALALAVAPLFGLGATAAQATECIAPSAPGGGWDFTCRTIGRLLSEQGLVEGNVKVTNMPGGVGAVTFAMVASERPDDEELIVATSTVGVTQIAQGRYPAAARLDALPRHARCRCRRHRGRGRKLLPEPRGAQRGARRRSRLGRHRGLEQRRRLGPHPAAAGRPGSRSRGSALSALGAVRRRHDAPSRRCSAARSTWSRPTSARSPASVDSGDITRARRRSRTNPIPAFPDIPTAKQPGPST